MALPARPQDRRTPGQATADDEPGAERGAQIGDTEPHELLIGVDVLSRFFCSQRGNAERDRIAQQRYRKRAG